MSKRPGRLKPDARIDDFATAERLLKTGQRLSAEQLANLLERNPNTVLPKVIHHYVIGLLRGAPSAAAWE